MPIVGLSSYCNFPRVDIILIKTVIIHSKIFSQKGFPLHVDFSTENITIFTLGSEKL